jgi:hypothetical protein
MDSGFVWLVDTGLHSSPVTPLINGLMDFFIHPSMWSKDRFSITKTTMVLMGYWGGGIAETTWEGIFVTWPYQNYVVLMFPSTFKAKTNEWG